MAYIFISYSKNNADYAHRLADKLRAEGFEVWIDKRRLATGEDWWKSIVLALRSCAAFVIIMTPESDDSRWVQREITLAEKYEKPVFPLWLAGNTDTPNWELFVRTQYEDVRDGALPGEDFYARLGDYALRQRGKNVTQEQPIIQAQADADDGDLADEIANPPPVNETLPAPPTAAAPAIPAQTPVRRSGTLVFAAVVGVIGVALLLFALAQSSQQNETPTSTTVPTQAIAALTTAPTSTIASSTTVNTSGNNPTTTPTPTPTSTTPPPRSGNVITAAAKSNALLRMPADNGTITLDGLNPLTGVVLLSRDSGGGQVEVQVSVQQTGWLLISELTNISGDVNTLSVNGAAPVIHQVTVIGTVRANLRRGPGSGFSVLQSVEPGTSFIAIGRNDSAGWLYVNVNGIRGWMSTALLDVDGNDMLLPIVES